MNIYVSSSRQRPSSAFLPTIAESNLSKQYQTASQIEQARRGVSGSRTYPEPKKTVQQNPVPPVQPPKCPLPAVLANCCARPAWQYECSASVKRPCSAVGSNGAYVPYSVNYRTLYRRSEQTTAKLYDGSPYKSFVDSQFSSSFK